MSLREEMARYEQLTGENAEHIPIIKIGAFLDGIDKGIEELEKIKEELKNLSENEWNKQVGADKGLELAIDVIEDRISALKENNTQKSEPDDFHEYWDEMAISNTAIYPIGMKNTSVRRKNK